LLWLFISPTTGAPPCLAVTVNVTLNNYK
jgi:hypothetical protein